MERGHLSQGYRLPGHYQGTGLILQQQLQAATTEHLQRATPLITGIGKCPPRVDIRFDLRGKAAGQAVWRQGRAPAIRYNLSMAREQPEAFLAETVPHEVAHVVCRILYPKARPHGPEWRSLMRYFGIEQPSRCHDFDSAQSPCRQQRRWHYRCNCRKHLLSTTRHYRILRGSSRYHCRQCGSELQPL